MLGVVLVLLAAGCGGSSGSGQSADDLVAESVKATSAVTSFHLSIDTENIATSDTGPR